MNSSGKLPVIILGGGGHASVLAEICIEQGRQILAIVAPELSITRQIFRGIRHIKNDDEVVSYNPTDVELVNGVGALPGCELRKQLTDRFCALGYHFASIVSQCATVSQTVKLKEGVQVLPRATINAGALVGKHSIINSGALIEHDCRIENFVHVAPSATVCGGTVIREGVHVGPSSVITQGLDIGRHSIIGAGSSIVRSLGDNSKVLPAKTIFEKRPKS